jgi:hypothetical protein
MTAESPFFESTHEPDARDPGGIIGVCPSCQKPVSHRANQTLRSRGEMTLAYGTCLSCHTPIFTLMVGKGLVHTSVDVSTDLQQPEIEKFWSSTAINEDSVLSLHERLSTSRSTQLFHS